MAKLRINGDSSGYVDLEVGSTGSNLTSTATTNTFNGNVGIGTSSSLTNLSVAGAESGVPSRVNIDVADSQNRTLTLSEQKITFAAPDTYGANYNAFINYGLSTLEFGSGNTTRMKITSTGGMKLSNITSTTEGMIFENSARVPGMANVQGSSGTGLIAAAQTIPTNTTTDIARTHWGGTVWVGYAGSGQQGMRKVDFGYARSPTVQYSAAWAGGATLTFTTSAYNLRVNHNAGNDLSFWLILMGV